MHSGNIRQILYKKYMVGLGDQLSFSF